MTSATPAETIRYVGAGSPEILCRATRSQGFRHDPAVAPGMPSTRLTVLVGVVAVLAVLQIAYEEVLVFLGATGTLPPGLRDSPFVMVAVPLAIALALVAILFGAAILHADTLR